MKKSMLFLLFFVFALSLAITLTINFPGLLKINLFFQSDINFQNWSRSQVNQDFRNLMGYLNNPFQKELVFDNLYVSDRGINHLCFFIKYFLTMMIGCLTIVQIQLSVFYRKHFSFYAFY